MQTSLLFLVSGIHKLFPSRSGAAPPLQKGDIHVQDCIHWPSSLQHAVRPPDGLDRPPADREQPHRHPQRRPSPFWSLTPVFRSFQRRKPAGASLANLHPGQWPRFAGPFSCGLSDGSDARRHLRQISRFGHEGQKAFAGWHIIYKNTPDARYQQSKSASGDGHVQSATDSNRETGEDRQCAHAFALSHAFQSTIGQKERMPRRLAPRTITSCNCRDEAIIAA